MYIIVSFLLLGIALLVSGIIMIVRMKQHFGDFFKLFGCYLYTANALLIAPLFLRSFSDVIKYNNEWHFIIGDSTNSSALYN